MFLASQTITSKTSKVHYERNLQLLIPVFVVAPEQTFAVVKFAQCHHTVPRLLAVLSVVILAEIRNVSKELAFAPPEFNLWHVARNRCLPKKTVAETAKETHMNGQELQQI